MTSAIEWTEQTWNPIRGCSRVSPGCSNCYAMRQARRFDVPGGPYDGLTIMRPKDSPRPGVDWLGRVRFVPKMLEVPFRRTKPTTYFVNSMSDLFHDALSNEQIAAVFGVMAACPRHTFQVLTKRAKRMREWFEWLADDTQELHGPTAPVACEIHAANHGADVDYLGKDPGWPLPNVWLGVSVEDQRTADQRIPHLLATPAAVRFVSAEPLLDPVDLSPYLVDDLHRMGRAPRAELDWVIVGGESGHGARPCNVAWIRSVVRQCRDALVPCFVKQLGSRSVVTAHPVVSKGRGYLRVNLRDRKGGDPSEWPENLRVREMPRFDAHSKPSGDPS